MLHCDICLNLVVKLSHFHYKTHLKSVLYYTYILLGQVKLEKKDIGSYENFANVINLTVKFIS